METKILKTETMSYEVTKKVWEKGNKKRYYFSLSNRGGNACWDCNEEEFIKVHGRVGVKTENKIKSLFNL